MSSEQLLCDKCKAPSGKRTESGEASKERHKSMQKRTHIRPHQHAKSVEVREAVDNVANSINGGETVIFCGAGMSRDSGFPVVAEFVPTVLLTLCAARDERIAIQSRLGKITDAQKRRNALRRIVAGKMGVSSGVVRKITDGFPFEAFMEILGKNTDIDSLLSIYDADAYDSNVEPNNNHLMLAGLVASGKVKTVVTTNFDQLIEKALARHGMKEGHDYDVIYKEGDFKRIRWAWDRCRLIKIHGSVDDKRAMAITLSQIAKQQLSEARASVIRRVFSQGHHKMVLILGYSCSDVFDISPQIEALAGGLKQVVVVQHSRDAGIESVCDQHEKNPFRAFKRSNRLFIDTGELVRTLWKATLNEPLRECKPLAGPDWKARIEAWRSDSLRTNSPAISTLTLGKILDEISEWRAALGLYDRALTHLREHPNDRLERITLDSMGDDHRHLCEYPEAVDAFEQCARMARGSNDEPSERSCLNKIAVCRWDTGDNQKAIEQWGKCLEMARRVGDWQAEGNSLCALSAAYKILGDYDKMSELYYQAFYIDGNTERAWTDGDALCTLAETFSEIGDHTKALRLSRQALEIYRQTGNVQGEGAALGDIGNALLSLHEHQQAIASYQQAIDVDRRILNVKNEAADLGNMGIAYVYLGQYRKAIRLYTRSLAIARRIGDADCEGTELANIGKAYSLLGERERSAKAFAQSEMVYAKHRLPAGINRIEQFRSQKW